jgi:ribonucleoside-diphosphate reductase alpha chain
MVLPEETAGIEIPTTTFEDIFSEEVWASTYKDYNDETINDTLRRVATFVASAEESEYLQDIWTERFYDMLAAFRCTAGGRIYSNAGTDWKGTTLMNCFVSPRESHDVDSLKNILHNVHNQTQTLKSEGGWGENFSYIRPRGAFIHGIGVESPGAIKYMELFDKSSDIITAGSGKTSANKKAKGKIRKGAMMGVLDVWHPDVIEFITAKQQPGRLSKFNISVNCSDEFMKQVLYVADLRAEGASDEELHAADTWKLRFPDTQFEKYKSEWSGDMKLWEEKGYPTITHKTVSATWLWDLIMESTYNRAEPGVLFLDRANYFSPLNYAETIHATNPCGEQTLAPGGVCNLGSVNLTQFVNSAGTGFDLDRIAKYVKRLVRFLDNINSLSNAPLPEYEDSMKKKRRIGCGILGWGSALYMLKVRFGSERAEELRDQVMQTIATEAYKASIDLAIEKGMFEYCEPEKHAEGPFIKSLNLGEEYMTKLRTTGIRNSSLLSVQPTGNTSIMANVVSGGLEPCFMHEYIRTVIVNTMPDTIAHVCPKWYEGEFHETEMFKFTKEGDEDILKGVGPNGTVYKIDVNRGLTKEVLCEDYGVRWLKARGEWDPTAEWAVTTESLDVQDHVTDLKGFARWVDSAMSKTVNVPNDYSFEDFKQIYTDSYKSGYVKGVTTYRSGTMTTVLAAKDEKDLDPDYEEEVILEDVKLPTTMPSRLSTLKSEGKKWYLTVVLNEQQTRPVAFFVHTNTHEATVSTQDAVKILFGLALDKGIPAKWVLETEEKMQKDSNSTKIARAISLLLRHGVLIKNIVNALDQMDDVYVGTFLFQIKKFLSTYIKDGEKSEGEKCLDCGSESVVYAEGCKKCVSCGSSKCG